MTIDRVVRLFRSGIESMRLRFICAKCGVEWKGGHICPPVPEIHPRASAFLPEKEKSK